jgi:hypothetical protein
MAPPQPLVRSRRDCFKPLGSTMDRVCYGYGIYLTC